VAQAGVLAIDTRRLDSGRSGRVFGERNREEVLGLILEIVWVETLQPLF
jgi:hypothetical protein